MFKIKEVKNIFIFLMSKISIQFIRTQKKYMNMVKCIECNKLPVLRSGKLNT